MIARGVVVIAVLVVVMFVIAELVVVVIVTVVVVMAVGATSRDVFIALLLECILCTPPRVHSLHSSSSGEKYSRTSPQAYFFAPLLG